MLHAQKLLYKKAMQNISYRDQCITWGGGGGGKGCIVASVYWAMFHSLNNWNENESVRNAEGRLNILPT